MVSEGKGEHRKKTKGRTETRRDWLEGVSLRQNVEKVNFSRKYITSGQQHYDFMSRSPPKN